MNLCCFCLNGMDVDLHYDTDEIFKDREAIFCAEFWEDVKAIAQRRLSSNIGLRDRSYWKGRLDEAKLKLSTYGGGYPSVEHYIDTELFSEGYPD